MRGVSGYSLLTRLINIPPPKPGRAPSSASLEATDVRKGEGDSVLEMRVSTEHRWQPSLWCPWFWFSVPRPCS